MGGFGLGENVIGIWVWEDGAVPRSLPTAIHQAHFPMYKPLLVSPLGS